MPLRPSRVGRVGVIGAPVAKTAVVAAAVTPAAARRLRRRPWWQRPSHPGWVAVEFSGPSTRLITGRSSA